jgi:hypothetical protein
MLVLGTDGKAERMKLETGKKKRPASWIPDHVVSTHHGPANQVGSFVIRDFSGNESLRAIFLARNFNFAWDRGSTVNVFFCLASATAMSCIADLAQLRNHVLHCCSHHFKHVRTQTSNAR